MRLARRRQWEVMYQVSKAARYEARKKPGIEHMHDAAGMGMDETTWQWTGVEGREELV